MRLLGRRVGEEMAGEEDGGGGGGDEWHLKVLSRSQ